MDYIELTQRSLSGILSFEAKMPEPPFHYDGRPLAELTDAQWTKSDLIHNMGISPSSSLLHSPTIFAGNIFIRKCDPALKIIIEWQKIIANNFSLVDDSPSTITNLPEFIGHRHDQSIFSLLGKINAIETISTCELWYPQKNNPKKPDWCSLIDYPIWIKRDKKRKDFLFVLVRNKIITIQKRLKGYFS